ncbi:MAG: hypothetical protein ABW003_10645 [Microvirga sp.]
MSASQKPSFGFADIQPTAVAAEPVARSIDAIGERLGFASREALVRRRRRQPVEEPTDQINIRAAIADINRFVEWCETERLSYREGFARLVTLLDQQPGAPVER